VTLRVANDYAAVIEGQRAGNIHIGYYGPASFSRARLTGVPTDAFVIDVNSDGSKGYYSVFYVMAKSPYQKIEDLKGKNLGLVDPNPPRATTCRSIHSINSASARTRFLRRRK
jgi:phosphonate transport system substrate-binding protein